MDNKAAQLSAILAQTDLFQGLSSFDIQTFAPLLQVRRAEVGELIIEEGAAGNALFVLLDGEVEVVKDVPAGAQHVLATLEAGECFGEMALIDGSARMASVRSTLPTTLAVLSREDFTSLLEENHPSATHILRRMAAILCERQRQLTYIMQDLVEAGPDADYDRDGLMSLLHRNLSQN